jgi:HPt (histidine-containing phosphotransfer) domain-containing protein
MLIIVILSIIIEIIIEFVIESYYKENIMATKIEKLRDWGCDIDGAFARFLNDEELFNECLIMFIDDENLTELKEHINDEDQQVPFVITHTLKGVAGNLGLTPLYESLVTLCESLRNNEYDPKSGYFEQVQSDIEKFLEIME